MKEIATTLPTCVVGIILGERRLESNGGESLYVEYDHPFIFLKRPSFFGFTPFAITHLQKKSRFWILLMSHLKWWQLCFHFALTFRFQQQDDKGNWLPGTERVLYFRLGYSRWDAGDGIYVGGYEFNLGRFKLRIPIGTWYGPGLHLD